MRRPFHLAVSARATISQRTADRALLGHEQALERLNHYISAWELIPDGDPIVTPHAQLLPVLRHRETAMLKVASEAEEKRGGLLLEWWDGVGAARVLASDGDAILIERALGGRSLTQFAQNGRDGEATEILCDVVAALHAPRTKPPPADLIPLHEWFRELRPAAASGGLLAYAAETAEILLADQRDIRPLHGDIHHDNVLDFGERGWLAIDPKRLIGDRAFDYANIFCNPDMDHPHPPVATRQDCFLRRVEVVTRRSGLERRRLLQWIVAWTGLSAAWLIGDGLSAAVDLRVGEMARAELSR